MNKAFLKWAGGKGALIEQLYSLMPRKHSGNLIEPFLGSGIVSLNAELGGFDNITVSDTNAALICLWKQLETNDKFIDRAQAYFNGKWNNEASYYQLRESFNDALKIFYDKGEVIGELFLYLNRHGFNGLCRFNKSGGFNVPFGKYDKPYFPEDELIHARNMTRLMNIHQCSFVDTFRVVKKGDVVYCDPPYLGVSDTSNFTAYSAGGFSYADQVDLVRAARVAQDKGATVIISNNAVPLAETLYKDATEKHYRDVQKNISCKGNGRNKQKEIIAVYRP